MKNNLPKIPLFFTIILLIFFTFAFIFLYKKINENNQKAEEGIATWTKEARRRDDIRSLDRSLKEMEGDRTLLETHFAKSSDVVPFLDTIEKLAPTVGASAQVESVNTIADNAGLVVGLKVSGNFSSIYKFLTLLENSPYELDFLSMDIHILTEGGMVGKVYKEPKWEAVFKMQLLTFVP